MVISPSAVRFPPKVTLGISKLAISLSDDYNIKFFSYDLSRFFLLPQQPPIFNMFGKSF